MIKGTELRIGNWVEFPNPEFKPLQILDGEMIDNWSPLSRAIPLTPEILEGCGFEKFGDWFIKKSYPIHVNVSLLHKKTTIGQNEEYEVEGIKYLHQLQNLYFALTGEELQINLHVDVTI